MKMSNVKKMSYSAMIIGLSFVLGRIPLFRMPFGGSITLFSMFAISLPGYFFGLQYGIASTIIYSLLKLMFGGYYLTPIQAILDYILTYLSFSVTGFAHRSKDIKSFLLTYIIAVFLRFIFNSISGYVFFAEYTPKNWNPLVYTITYNALYIFTEAIITIVLLMVPYINKKFLSIKEKI